MVSSTSLTLPQDKVSVLAEKKPIMDRSKCFKLIAVIYDPKRIQKKKRKGGTESYNGFQNQHRLNPRITILPHIDSVTGNAEGQFQYSIL